MKKYLLLIFLILAGLTFFFPKDPLAKEEILFRIEKGQGPKETVNPAGKGVEASAPLHEYEIEAKGEIYGPVKEIINLYGEAEHKDMVELGSIKLV